VINIKFAFSALVAASAFVAFAAHAQRAVGERTSSGQIVKSTSEVKAAPSKRSGNAVALTPKQVQERQTIARDQQSAISASKVPVPRALAASTSSGNSTKAKITTIISKDGKVSYGANK
jgi:hypothetical protein